MIQWYWFFICNLFNTKILTDGFESDRLKPKIPAHTFCQIPQKYPCCVQRIHMVSPNEI